MESLTKKSKQKEKKFWAFTFKVPSGRKICDNCGKELDTYLVIISSLGGIPYYFCSWKCLNTFSQHEIDEDKKLTKSYVSFTCGWNI